MDSVTPTHYLDILNTLTVHAPVQTQWKEHVLADLTKGGQLALESLPTDSRGHAFGIRGEQYFCTAVAHRTRPDVIFVVGIRLSASQLVRDKTHYYSAELSLVQRVSETLPPLDAVQPLLGLVPPYSRLRATTQPGVRTPSDRLRLTPSGPIMPSTAVTSVTVVADLADPLEGGATGKLVLAPQTGADQMTPTESGAGVSSPVVQTQEADAEEGATPGPEQRLTPESNTPTSVAPLLPFAPPAVAPSDTSVADSATFADLLTRQRHTLGTLVKAFQLEASELAPKVKGAAKPLADHLIGLGQLFAEELAGILSRASRNLARHGDMERAAEQLQFALRAADAAPLDAAPVRARVTAVGQFLFDRDATAAAADTLLEFKTLAERLDGVAMKSAGSVDVVATVADDLASCYEKLPRELQHAHLNLLIEARKKIRTMRRDDRTDDGQVALTRALVYLNRGLKNRVGVVGVKRLMDLYEFYDSLRLQPALWPEFGAPASIYEALREATECADQLAASGYCDVERSDQVWHSFVASRAGEVYHASFNYSPPETRSRLLLEKAVQWFRKSLELAPDPNDSGLIEFAVFRLGFCQLELEQYEEAIQWFQRVAAAADQCRPETIWEAHVRMAECYAALASEAKREGADATVLGTLWRQVEDCLLSGHRVYCPDPDIPATETTSSVLIGLFADHYSQSSQFEKSLPFYPKVLERAAREHPDNRTLYDLYLYRWSAALMKCGQVDEALIRLEQLLSRNPDSEYLPTYYGAIKQACLQATDSELRTRMTALLRERYDPLPDDITPRYPEITVEDDLSAKADLGNRVRLLLDDRRSREAMAILDELFAEALRLGNWRVVSDRYFLSLHARAHRSLGNPAEAMLIYRKVMDVDTSPRNQAFAWFGLGCIFSDQADLAEALEAFEKAIALDGHPSARLKAAMVLSRMASYDQAIDLLDTLIRSPRDQRPAFTHTARAQVLWRRYLAQRNEADAAAAIKDLEAALQFSPDDVHVLAILGQTCDHPEGQALVVEQLRTTRDAKTIRALTASLARSDGFPNAVLEASLQEAASPAANRVLVAAHMKLVARGLFRAYHADGADNFSALARRVFAFIVGRDDAVNAHLLFELYVAERSAPLFELVKLYGERAQILFEPLFTDDDTALLNLTGSGFLARIQAFLIEDSLEDLRPKAFGFADGRDPFTLLCDIVENEIQPRLLDTFAGTIDVNVTESAEPASISLSAWTHIRRALKALLDLQGGPLAPLFEPDPSRISQDGGVALDDGTRMSSGGCGLSLTARLSSIILRGEIDGLRGFPPVETRIANSQERLSAFVARHGGVASIEASGSRVSVSVTIPFETPRLWLPAKLAPFQAFLDLLAYEEERVLVGEGLRSDFYREAAASFDTAWEATGPFSSEHATALLQQVFDLQHSIAANWLLAPPAPSEQGRHPRVFVHGMKQKVENALRARAAGKEPDAALLRTLRRDAAQLVDACMRTVGGEVWQADAPPLDLGALLRQVVAQSQPPTSVRATITCPLDTYVSAERAFLARAMLNLLSNAYDATAKLEHGYVTVTAEPEPDGRSVLLVIINSYDPDLPARDASTGIGLNEARYLVETLCRGTLRENPVPAEQRYEVHISLSLDAAEPLDQRSVA